MTADNQKPDSSTTTTTTDTAVPSTANQPGTTVEHVIEPQHAETGGEPHERVVAIALDNSQYSEHAFKWAMNNLIDPARDLVVLMNVRPYVSAPILYTAPMMDLGGKRERERDLYG